MSPIWIPAPRSGHSASQTAIWSPTFSISRTWVTRLTFPESPGVVASGTCASSWLLGTPRKDRRCPTSCDCRFPTARSCSRSATCGPAPPRSTATALSAGPTTRTSSSGCRCAHANGVAGPSISCSIALARTGRSSCSRRPAAVTSSSGSRHGPAGRRGPTSPCPGTRRRAATGDPRRHPRALPVDVQPPTGHHRPPRAAGRRLRRRARRADRRHRRTQVTRRPGGDDDRRQAALPPRRARRRAERGRRRRGPLLRGVQARARPSGRRRRWTRRGGGPLPERADRVRRDPPARPGVDLPLSRRRRRPPPRGRRCRTTGRRSRAGRGGATTRADHRGRSGRGHAMPAWPSPIEVDSPRTSGPPTRRRTRPPSATTDGCGRWRDRAQGGRSPSSSAG